MIGDSDTADNEMILTHNFLKSRHEEIILLSSPGPSPSPSPCPKSNKSPPKKEKRRIWTLG